MKRRTGVHLCSIGSPKNGQQKAPPCLAVLTRYGSVWFPSNISGEKRKARCVGSTWKQKPLGKPNGMDRLKAI
ncbi:hypothetical protein YUWDRAFT_06776 [Streptomyces sp. AmelKG-D3]|nr:hypothetical protein YUWDRAFT_06776 [Streptomyces sp. AmelKG-D3]